MGGILLVLNFLFGFGFEGGDQILHFFISTLVTERYK